MAVIGIDLGTTNSCIAHIKNGRPEVVQDIGGRTTVPSIVSFTKNEGTSEIIKLCGYPAYQQMLVNTENTVSCIKRFIGQSYRNPVVTQLLPTLSYKIVPNEKNEGIEIFIPATDQRYSPEEISSFLLTELRAIAERFIGEPVNKAVITVPAYFNNKQRQATRDAGLIAGLEVLRIINEPTAAAMAYGFMQAGNDEKLLAVFDFGGGTFDITIMEVSRGTFNVIATAGNTFLGGEDITNSLFDHILGVLMQKHQMSDIDDKLVIQRLRDYAESAKKMLSTQEKVDIEVPYLKEMNGAFIHFKTEVTRSLLEELAMPIVQKAITTFDRALDEIKLDPQKLEGIILIGGQTRMPLVQRLIKERFPRTNILKNINPDETVAIGAAYQATLLEDDLGIPNSQDTLLLDVTPHNLGIAIGKDMFYTLIPKNSTVPTSVDDIFVTSRDHQDRARILLLQGDSSLATENDVLGEFELTNLRKAPRGEVKIKVTYEIDMNGIVTVEAIDLDTGQKQKITVASSSNLSSDELKKKIGENSDYYLELAEKTMTSELIRNITDCIYEIEKIKPKLYQVLQASELGVEQIDKMEILLTSTKNYLKNPELELEKLQSIEAKLDTLKSTYTNLLERSSED
ncbi:MAG TPA: Hsp70 family protein [bacterium]|nr:Hsp70 family protein [bacterium]